MKNGGAYEISDKRGEQLLANLKSLQDRKRAINVDGKGTMINPNSIDQIIPEDVYHVFWKTPAVQTEWSDIIKENLKELKEHGKYGQKRII
jgi:hypothetical protein